MFRQDRSGMGDSLAKRCGEMSPVCWLAVALTSACVGGLLMASPARADAELQEPPPNTAPAPLSGGAEEPGGGPPPSAVLGPEEEVVHRRRLPITWGALAEALYAGIDGHVEMERGTDGDRIDLDDDVPLERMAWGMRSSGWFGLAGALGLEGGYLWVKHRGRGSIDTVVIHRGEVFEPGERVEVVSELQTAWLGLRWETWFGDVRAVGSVGAWWGSQRLGIRSREDGAGAADRLEVYSPYIGFLFDAPYLDREGDGVGIELETRLFGYGDEDTDFGFFEFHVRVYGQLAGSARATVGFTYLLVDYLDYDRGRDEEEVLVDLVALSLGLAVFF
jgi:hypothetical protein